MKTQIKDIINGAKNQIFDANNEKYANLPLWQICEVGTFKGAGTSYAIRADRFAKVKDENGEKLLVNFAGENVEMKLTTSCSGKTCWYVGAINIDTYRRLCSLGISTKREPKPIVLMYSDCTIEIKCGNYSIAVGTEYIEIL